MSRGELDLQVDGVVADEFVIWTPRDKLTGSVMGQSPILRYQDR